MFMAPRMESGDERRAVANPCPRLVGDQDFVRNQATSNIQAAIDTLNHARGAAGRTVRESVRNGFGLLSLTALTFATMKDAWAADANLTFLDDDNIAFKDLQHGTFELVTKEAVPRYIIVGDPGETIVLNRTGSSVSVSQFTNNAARMEELQAAQREVHANLTEGFGTHGSGTPTFIDPAVLQPINFTQPGSAAAQEALPALPSIQPIPEFIFIRASLPEPQPTLTLALGTGPTETDTVVFDTFATTSGTFSANSSNSAATLTYGISGGAPGNTVLDGVAYNVSQADQYGTLYVNSATGAYTFVPNDDAINALKTPTTASFLITVSDGTISANQTFTIDIDGVNDHAVISGNVTGSLTDGDSGGGARLAMAFAAAATAPRSASGTLTSTDVDDPHNAFTAVDTPTASNGGYGTFTMTADGVWTYTLDDANSAVRALNVGDRLGDTFTVTTVDGTAQMVTIVIGGINDAAIISGDTAGAVVEAACNDPGIPIAAGVLHSTDIDNPSNTFTPVESQESDGAYGTFTMAADGKWTYTLDNDNCDVQALNVGGTLTDTFRVTTEDGTEQAITITIGGTNDAAIISGNTCGAVAEASCRDPGTPIAAGSLTSTDIDNPSNAFTPVKCGKSDGGYGTFTITADGKWTYMLDNDNCTVQSLNECDTLTDTFTVTTEDGTGQIIKITIGGNNDAATVSGNTCGAVVEATCKEPGFPIATGSLTAADVDNTPDTFMPVKCGESDGGYGTFTMTADGKWTYMLDNDNYTVQSLNDCDTLTDTFTVRTEDGTGQLVKITIGGTNDAAIVSGNTCGAVVEAGCKDPGIPIAKGTLTAADVDNTPNTFTPVKCGESDGGYGTFAMTADGKWTYKLDNDNCTVQSLNDCDTLTDTFTVTTEDGTEQAIKITIGGSNDAAIAGHMAHDWML